MVSSGDAQNWTLREPEFNGSDGEYEVEDEKFKVKRSRFAVTQLGFGAYFIVV